MNRINVDVPRRALVVNLAVAAIAAAGITSLTGAPAVLAVPILTAVLAYVLLVWARVPQARPRPAGGGATTDPLTALPTEDVGSETLAREFAAAQRGRPLTVVLLRIEGLSRYRARHGKGVADQLLRVTGRTLARHCRGMHLTARHGGRDGTFLSVLSASDRQGAAVYAARLRRDLVQPTGLPAPDGVSIGIASYDMGMASPSDLVRTAEYAMEKGAEAGGKMMIVGDSA